jgi:uncharacterized protein YggU (UPF0235/DUF167 family)
VTRDGQRGVRVCIHVRPGARTAGTGGPHGDALVVRVREHAIDGKATEAALRALAAALEINRRDIRLISGTTSRAKVVEIPDSTADRFAMLREGEQR